MSPPPEDLVLAARKCDPKYADLIRMPDFNPAATDWRLRVPFEVQRLWDRLDYETRLAVFVTAWANA